MNWMDLEIRHLRLVAAIAETGGVTRAGERLHLSQSALSHQLRDIEDRLGAPLFHRIGKRMVLTADGQELLRLATDVLERVGRAEEAIKQRSAGGAGVLRITTGCYTCYHWLPAILKEYRMAHAKVDVRVDASATADPLRSLLDGRIDLAVTSERAADHRVVEQPLFEDDLVVIMAPDHPLASRPFVDPQDLADETVIIYPPREDSTLLRALAEAAIAPAAVQQVELTEAIIELVKANLGVATLARWVAAPYVRAGSLKAARFTRAGYRRRWGAIVRRDMAAVPYVQHFISLLAKRAPVEIRRRKPGLLTFETPGRIAAR
ncbi:MAG TPA: LysR substrate-binding domain-containing protein [Vicinamibacterales bacterium]|jgi:LysR family transcriptional regulator for metE and metH|nr:LysR substrate-binding domain-containing protein [Vicinamibacterales bacterium]